MPSRADCDHCPFRADAETPCAAVQLDDPLWCHRTNPRRAIWRPTAVQELRRVTFEMLGRPVPDDFPTLKEQAGNLIRAVGLFVASGLARTTPEEKAERLAICQACEHFTGKRCRLCGCRTAYKLAMRTEACPVGKWPAIAPTTPAP